MEGENQEEAVKGVEKKKGSKNKALKIALVIAIIIILIAGTVGGYFFYMYKEENKSVGTTWGDSYYAYLKAAIDPEKDDEAVGSKALVPEEAQDAKLQFIEVEENEDPLMVITYTSNDIKYARVSKQTNLDYPNSVISTLYTNVTLEYLYNISLKQYIWYIHIEEETQDLYKQLSVDMGEAVEILTQNDTQSGDTETSEDNTTLGNEATETTVAEEDTQEDLTEYTIAKGSSTTVETLEGETLSISEFDQTFIKPEVEGSVQIDIDLNNMNKKELKEAVTETVAGYKTDSDIVTEEVETAVSEEVTAVDTKLAEIQAAEAAIAQKEAEEEAARQAAEEIARQETEENSFEEGTYSWLVPNDYDAAGSFVNITFAGGNVTEVKTYYGSSRTGTYAVTGNTLVITYTKSTEYSTIDGSKSERSINETEKFTINGDGSITSQYGIVYEK